MKKGKSRMIARRNLIKNQKKAMKSGGQRFDSRRAYNRRDYDGQGETDPGLGPGGSRSLSIFRGS